MRAVGMGRRSYKLAERMERATKKRKWEGRGRSSDDEKLSWNRKTFSEGSRHNYCEVRRWRGPSCNED